MGGQIDAHDFRLLGLIRDVSFDARHLFVVMPLVVDVFLSQREQILGVLGIGPRQHGEASLLHGKFFKRLARLAAVEVERMFARPGRPRVVAVQRPEAGLHDVLLMRHRRRHVDAVGDAVAVGQDQRRPAIRLRLAERPHRLGRIAAHRDLGDVDVAVRNGQHAQVLLARRFAGGGEFRHRRPRRRLGRLAARVRIDARVEHQDVDVAARGEHVIQSAEADVVGPAIAADDPHAAFDQHIGDGGELVRRGFFGRGQSLPQLRPPARVARPMSASSC